MARRRLISEAGKGEMGSNNLVEGLQRNVKASWVCKGSSTLPQLKNKRIQRTTAIEANHTNARLSCYREKVTWNQ